MKWLQYFHFSHFLKHLIIIYLFRKPTEVRQNEQHYNMKRSSWDVRTLLEVFSREFTHKVCIKMSIIFDMFTTCFRKKSKNEFPKPIKVTIDFLFDNCSLHLIFYFWLLVTFGDKVTKIQKYYVIFLCKARCKKKTVKKITQLKWPKNQKT